MSIRGGATLTLGQECFVNNDVYFDCDGDVTVGDATLFAVGVTVLTSDHELRGPEWDLAYSPPIARPVTIGSQVWLGARAIVMPGVVIGDECVIGAGSVVTRDCAPGGVYVGSPARRIREAPHAAGRTEAGRSEAGRSEAGQSEKAASALPLRRSAAGAGHHPAAATGVDAA
ncbi:MAG TPA: acyltransferase [Cellulomonas sp.]